VEKRKISCLQAAMECRFLGRPARSLVTKFIAMLENIEIVMKNTLPYVLQEVRHI
jgi:hypothetical protein